MTKFNSPVVMPIGKYKGQPVEIINQDVSYKDWLLAQDWFKAKFGDIHTLILNNFHAPQNTPEHNALQARFLDTDWLVNIFDDSGDLQFKNVSIEFEPIGYDVLVTGLKRRLSKWSIELIKLDRIKSTLLVPDFEPKEKYPYCDRNTTEERIDRINRDIAWEGYERFAMGIQLKPSIGDDYPAILRQLKSTPKDVDHKCLFYQQWTGSGVSEEIFIKVMENENIITKKI